MAKSVRVELEGAVLDIPLRWDGLARREIRDYGPFLEGSPVYTPAGCPILLTIEDACPHAEMVDNDPTSIDCGACKHFWQPPGSLLGVCHHPARRWDGRKEAEKNG